MATPDANQTLQFRLDPVACVYSLENLVLGHSASAIRKSLITSGHSAWQADRIVNYAIKYRQEHKGHDLERLSSGIMAEVRDLPNPMPLPVIQVPDGMDLINHVAQCVAMGCDPLDVKKQLMGFGFTASNAEKYVADTIEWMRKNPYAGNWTETNSEKSRVNANMIMGAAICILGIVATIATIFVASRMGGTYVIAWGAIVFGALQFLKGASESGREIEHENLVQTRSRGEASRP